MANSKAARARRKEALNFVIDSLPNPDDFTTHDLLNMGDLLRSTTWPPYTKQAWQRVAMRADTIGHALSRHPEFEKHPEGVVDRSRRGTRIRTQRWRRRQ